MKICMMSLMMGNAPAREIVDTAVQCKMEAIDWIGLHHTAPKELKKLCDDAGLPVAAHTMFKSQWNGTEDVVPNTPQYIEYFKASLEDALTLGAPVLMVPPFPLMNRTTPDDDRKRYIEFYAQAAPVAKKAGVTLTLESTGYLHSPITTAKECFEVLTSVPDLRLTFDQGNTATADDPVAALKKLRPYIVHFHLKEWKTSLHPRPGYDLKRCGQYFAEALIGDGDMKIAEFWKETTAQERTLYVNPETHDPAGKMSHLETFRLVCARMRAMEE